MNKKICIIGIGGAGINTLNRIAHNDNIHNDNICRIAIDEEGNTNIDSRIDYVFHSYEDLTTGDICISDADDSSLTNVIGNSKIVLICAGLGGKTGSLLTTRVATLANDNNKMVLAVVFNPFTFEGRIRSERASAARLQIMNVVDYQIVISNNSLLEMTSATSTMSDAFAGANDVVIDVINAITSILAIHSNNDNMIKEDISHSRLTCPVCKSALEEIMQKCRVCGFEHTNNEFINKEEAENWMTTVVLPAKQEWDSKKQTDSNIKELIVEELNKKLSDNSILEFFGN